MLLMESVKVFFQGSHKGEMERWSQGLCVMKGTWEAPVKNKLHFNPDSYADLQCDLGRSVNLSEAQFPHVECN